MIYSPSSREDYCFCPRMWWLRKKGYVTRSMGYPELCAMGGHAVGVAMEYWNFRRIKGVDTTKLQLVEIGLRDLTQAQETNEKNGRRVESLKASEFIELLPQKVSQAVELLYEKDPLKEYTILAAEEEFPEAGNSRLDVRVQRRDGRQIVFDYKVKFGTMDEKWIDGEFEKHASGEQRLTYTSLTNTDMFGIIMVLLSPSKNRAPLPPRIEVRTWSVTEDEQKVWRRDAELLTPLMTQTLTMDLPEQVPGKTFPHANKFGECTYYDACIRYALDPERMRLDYIQIQKGGE